MKSNTLLWVVGAAVAGYFLFRPKQPDITVPATPAAEGKPTVSPTNIPVTTTYTGPKVTTVSVPPVTNPISTYTGISGL